MVGNVCGNGFSAWLAKCWNHTLPSPEQLRPFPSEEKGRDEGCLGIPVFPLLEHLQT